MRATAPPRALGKLDILTGASAGPGGVSHVCLDEYVPMWESGLGRAPLSRTPTPRSYRDFLLVRPAAAASRVAAAVPAGSAAGVSAEVRKARRLRRLARAEAARADARSYPMSGAMAQLVASGGAAGVVAVVSGPQMAGIVKDGYPLWADVSSTDEDEYTPKRNHASLAADEIEEEEGADGDDDEDDEDEDEYDDDEYTGRDPFRVRPAANERRAHRRHRRRRQRARRNGNVRPASRAAAAAPWTIRLLPATYTVGQLQPLVTVPVPYSVDAVELRSLYLRSVLSRWFATNSTLPGTVLARLLARNAEDAIAHLVGRGEYQVRTEKTWDTV